MGVSEADWQRRRLDELASRQDEQAKRQAELEQRMDSLDRLADTLRREAVNTRRAVREMKRAVANLPDREEMRALIAEGLLEASGKWPPAAVALVGASLALVVGIVLAALHLIAFHL